MINIIVAFWIGLLVGLMCFALSNANKEAERREIDMWRLKVEREKAEELERLKKRVEVLEAESDDFSRLTLTMGIWIAEKSGMTLDNVFETFRDIAKEAKVEEATR